MESKNLWLFHDKDQEIVDEIKVKRGTLKRSHFSNIIYYNHQSFTHARDWKSFKVSDIIRDKKKSQVL